MYTNEVPTRRTYRYTAFQELSNVQRRVNTRYLAMYRGYVTLSAIATALGYTDVLMPGVAGRSGVAGASQPPHV